MAGEVFRIARGQIGVVGRRSRYDFATNTRRNERDGSPSNSFTCDWYLQLTSNETSAIGCAYVACPSGVDGIVESGLSCLQGSSAILTCFFDEAPEDGTRPYEPL